MFDCLIPKDFDHLILTYYQFPRKVSPYPFKYSLLTLAFVRLFVHVTLLNKIRVIFYSFSFDSMLTRLFSAVNPF